MGRSWANVMFGGSRETYSAVVTTQIVAWSVVCADVVGWCRGHACSALDS